MSGNKQRTWPSLTTVFWWRRSTRLDDLTIVFQHHTWGAQAPESESSRSTVPGKRLHRIVVVNQQGRGHVVGMKQGEVPDIQIEQLPERIPIPSAISRIGTGG